MSENHVSEMSEGRTVGVGILGAGKPNIATSQHIPACKMAKHVELIALCDRLDTVNEFASKAGVDAYTDYPLMLADPRIEMVQVCTPDPFHCEHAEMALEAGKNVLLQKPPCLSRTELDRLRHIAGEAPGKLNVMLNQRNTMIPRTIKHYLTSGIIGELREIIIRHRGRRFPIEDPASFYLRKESGGVWMHNSLHWLDEAFFYSENKAEDIQLFSTKNDQGEAKYLGEGDNYWSAVFSMGKVSFLFEYNAMLLKDGLPSGVQRVLIGTKGELRQNYGQADLIVFSKDKDGPEILPPFEEDFDSIDDVVRSFQIGIDSFAQEILDGTPRAPFVDDTFSLFELLLEGVR